MSELTDTVDVHITLNGQSINATIPARGNLADFIRHRIGLMGTNIGCEQGICGACTVRLDGEIVRSCLTLAAQASGHDVDTIESREQSHLVEFPADH